jgi:monoamine oxidase
MQGGYDQLVNYLQRNCRELGCIIETRRRVSGIRWKKNEATVVTDENQIYNCNKTIVTIALGLLQVEPSPIVFDPAISNYLQAATKIGYGSVIKVLLQFSEPFWEEHKRNIGFILTNQAIPTWWTQRPSDYPLLTGWAGGPRAMKMQENSDDEILELALRSLSNVFKRPLNQLQKLLTASLVANWRNDPYSKGGYSYSTLESTGAQKLFSAPVEDTIFFAGEAFYDGPSPGTVEAALVSAKNSVSKLTDGGKQ